MKKYLPIILLFVLTLSVCGTCAAQDGVPPEQVPPKDSGGTINIEPLVRTLAALAIVVVLILAARFVIQKYSGKIQPGKTSDIEILSRKSLTFKHQLMIVRAGGKKLLVGVAAEGISKICELDDSDETIDQEQG